MISLIYHPDYLRHDTGTYHPECAQRLVSIVEHLKTSRIKESILWVSPRPAEIDEIGLVHSTSYIQYVRSSAANHISALDADTPLCPLSYEVALLAAGGMLCAIDEVLQGKSQTAMALVRPPGHHAEPKKGMGFCLFNNIAIGARYSQKAYQISKVAIIDIDVHHGNGTQKAFYQDASVFYCSLHQYPFYPGSGAISEIGESDGKGFILNLPLGSGSNDKDYQRIFEERLSPRVIEYKPEIILVSAGFDAYEYDQLGGMSLTQEGYRMLGRLLKNLAADTCPIVSVLEGGYNLSSLGSLVEAYLSAWSN